MQQNLRSLIVLPRSRWLQALILVAIAWSLPLLIQLLPWTGAQPLTAHLLPLHWAVFAAIYLFGGTMGLFVALAGAVAIVFNFGQIAVAPAEVMTLELIGFVVLATLLKNRWYTLQFAAPLAWLGAKIGLAAVAWFVPVLSLTRDPFGDVVSAVAVAMVGLGALLAINVALVELLPQDEDWDSA
ncbi:MAG: hypothetical protein Q8M02_12075 [Candidatus Didemnitutus sp.]|nr:hypothetical protein [Candidatus Didemnitutus sp.]